MILSTQCSLFMVQIVVDNIINIGVSTRVSQSISVKAKERGCTNEYDRGKGKKSRSTKIIFMVFTAGATIGNVYREN